MAWNFDLTITNFLDFQTACDEIQAAIIERVKAMNNPSLIAFIPARNKLEPTQKNNSWAEWAYDTILQLWFTGFAGNIFINHTDSGGDWNNNSGQAPLWNSTTLLAKIGDAAFFNPNNDPFKLDLHFWGSFIEQSYKILNELLWLRLQADDITRFDKGLNGGNGDSYAVVQTAFNALAFAPGGGTAKSQSEWDAVNNRFRIFRDYNVMENNSNSNSDLINYDFDLYVFFKNGANPTTDVYNNPDYATVDEDRYGLTETGSGNTQKETGEVGNFNNSNQPNPFGLVAPLRTYIWTIDTTNVYMIEKFDVVDGFVYVL